ncbi:integrase family protein 11 [Bordetella holmesii 1058]|uniref:Integrase family protein 11 n=1 Tax=Bordetella holmesii 1058 TaxID=1247648 RepID=A0ABN0S4T7_9BORD|nr:integrase family protein 11 [Bordetella holmesii 1058]
MAFTDIHPDERFPSAVQFLKDAVAYYQRLGVTIQRCSPTMARPFAAAPSPRCAMSWASSTALPDLTATDQWQGRTLHPVGLA